MGPLLLESLRAWWPEAILSAGAFLVILLGTAARRTAMPFVIAWAALIASGAALWRTPVSSMDLFFGLITCDAFSLAFRWFAWGTTAIVTLLAVSSTRDVASHRRGEYVGLLLLIGVGLMLMAEANHLLMAYVAMEMVSLSSYLLVGLCDDYRSAEAAMKYLLFGALSSGIMLFGMSLLFGLTGQLSFPGLLRASGGLGGPMFMAFVVAITLMLAGLAFKISMVPFHLWTPDAYEGAPIPVTALLSVGPKAAGLALLLRLMTALQPAWSVLGPILASLTILTMTMGNLVALVQTNVKRLLAYSTIGQAGYLLIGFVVTTPAGREALLTYLVAYLFMNLGAFACVVVVFNESGSEALDAFQGLAKRAPIVALLCTFFLLSLAGLPPFLGFFGKFLLFGSAVKSGYVWLAVAGVVNSAVALYYYVNIIRLMYVVSPQRTSTVALTLPLRLVLGVCAAVTVLVGLFPAALLSALNASAVTNLL